MLKTFNCGVGFCLIISPKNFEKTKKIFSKKFKPYIIGKISLRLEARAAAAAEPAASPPASPPKRDTWRDARGHTHARASGRGRKGDDAAAIRMRDEAPIYALDRDDPNCDD